jgi:hypothetical protein
MLAMARGLRRPETAGDDTADGPIQRSNLEALLRAPVPVETMGAMWSDIILEGCGRLAALDPDRVTALSYEALLYGAEKKGRRGTSAGFSGAGTRL